jgi:hypothetical protein
MQVRFVLQKDWSEKRHCISSEDSFFENLVLGGNLWRFSTSWLKLTPSLQRSLNYPKSVDKVMYYWTCSQAFSFHFRDYSEAPGKSISCSKKRASVCWCLWLRWTVQVKQKEARVRTAHAWPNRSLTKPNDDRRLHIGPPSRPMSGSA